MVTYKNFYFDFFFYTFILVIYTPYIDIIFTLRFTLLIHTYTPVFSVKFVRLPSRRFPFSTPLIRRRPQEQSSCYGRPQHRNHHQQIKREDRPDSSADRSRERRN